MVVVIGSINLDLITTVERLPGAGETVPGTSFTTAAGGKGANQALAAARAGRDVKMVGAVGSDSFAEQALALLKQGGVDLSAVARADAPTGTAVILVGATGENMIAVVAGANDAVMPDSFSDTVIAAGDCLLLQHEIPLKTVRAALTAARSAAATSILNTAPFRKDAAGLLPLADYVVANETEFDLYAALLSLSGADRPAQMSDFVSRTGRRIIVTLGGEGAIAATTQGEIRVPALKIEPVDTVGAGDTFCGYLAAALEEGLDLEASLRRAAAAGALACLRPGAQPAIPFRAEVIAALS